MREMKAQVGDLGARLNGRGMEQSLVAVMCSADTVLAENERIL